jgi:hypothetical protein
METVSGCIQEVRGWGRSLELTRLCGHFPCFLVISASFAPNKNIILES